MLELHQASRPITLWVSYAPPTIIIICLLAACWPLAGRLLAACWPRAGRVLAASWPLPGRFLAATASAARASARSTWRSGVGYRSLSLPARLR